MKNQYVGPGLVSHLPDSQACGAGDYQNHSVCLVELVILLCYHRTPRCISLGQEIF